MKITKVLSDFYPEEKSAPKTGIIKITLEMSLSSVIDTFNFKLLTEREFLMKIRML